MESPRSGFRRAAATSWALAGIGAAGVAGASTLAYADTFRPATDAPVEVAIPDAPQEFASSPAPASAPVPEAISTTVDPPPIPAPIMSAPPTVTTEAPVTKYTPEQTYQQAPRHSAAPAPTQVSTAPTIKRHVSVPTTVQSPKYSPHVTVSRGS